MQNFQPLAFSDRESLIQKCEEQIDTIFKWQNETFLQAQMLALPEHKHIRYKRNAAILLGIVMMATTLVLLCSGIITSPEDQLSGLAGFGIFSLFATIGTSIWMIISHDIRQEKVLGAGYWPVRKKYRKKSLNVDKEFAELTQDVTALIGADRVRSEMLRVVDQMKADYDRCIQDHIYEHDLFERAGTLKKLLVTLSLSHGLSTGEQTEMISQIREQFNLQAEPELLTQTA